MRTERVQEEMMRRTWEEQDEIKRRSRREDRRKLYSSPQLGNWKDH